MTVGKACELVAIVSKGMSTKSCGAGGGVKRFPLYFDALALTMMSKIDLRSFPRCSSNSQSEERS